MISLVVTLILIGVGLYVINTLIPMDSKIKTIINIVVIIVVILWLADVFGVIDMPVPRLRSR